MYGCLLLEILNLRFKKIFFIPITYFCFVMNQALELENKTNITY